MQAHATFKITSADEKPFSEVEGGTALAHGHFVITYSGDLQGEGVLEELKIYSPDKVGALIYGLERVTGTLKGKQGSFVLQHVGKLQNGVITSKRSVMPHTGTGELKNLRGEINFESGSAGQFPVTFDYQLA